MKATKSLELSRTFKLRDPQQRCPSGCFCLWPRRPVIRWCCRFTCLLASVVPATSRSFEFHSPQSQGPTQSLHALRETASLTSHGQHKVKGGLGITCHGFWKHSYEEKSYKRYILSFSKYWRPKSSSQQQEKQETQAISNQHNLYISALSKYVLSFWINDWMNERTGWRNKNRIIMCWTFMWILLLDPQNSILDSD